MGLPKSSGNTESYGVSILGGAQISLTLLEKIMDGIPVPFVKSVAGAAVEVIKMARVMQSNREECDDLVQRSTSLLVVILRSFDGKTEAAIPSHLREGVERLASNFHEVLATLQTIDKRAGKRSVSAIAKALVYHLDNAEKLKGCSAKLNWAMQEFQVTTKVESCLKELEQYHEIRKDLEEIKKGLMGIQLAGEGQTRDDVASLPSTVMPAEPKIFGRAEYIEFAIKLIFTNGSSHIVILGPGGMGKTSVALKIIYDARVIERFGINRIWLPCEQATSVNLFIELLAKVLKLSSSSSNDRFEDVVKMLEASDTIYIFLLDNFETLLEIAGQQSHLGDVLSRIASIPSVSFIITMRGSHYPFCELIDWSHPPLPPLTQLDLDPATEAFLRISPKSEADSELPTLLQELDCMPLAITLMAKLARAGETVSQLLSQWRSERTRLLDQPGGDRRTSIEVSIKLSLDSQAVKGNPDTIRLLGVFAMLPGGAAQDRIPDMCPSIPGWRAALRALLGAALVHYDSDNISIQMLSPIRSYVLLHHPPEPETLKDLRSSYYKLAEKGRSEPGDPDHNANTTEISKEEANIEYTLLGVLQSNEVDVDSAISASLGYTNYLYGNQPRSDVIAAALRRAKSSESWPTQHADCMLELGRIHYTRCQYDAARTALEQARSEYLKLGSRRGNAQCLQTLGMVFLVQDQLEQATTAFRGAETEYIGLDDKIGTFKCRRDLGYILLSQGKLDEAAVLLEDVKMQSELLGDRFSATICLAMLGEVRYSQGQKDSARIAFEEAVTLFAALGSRFSAARCQWFLGDLLWENGQLNKAYITLKEAKAEFVRIGDPLNTANCMFSLGRVFLATNEYGDALKELEEAKRLYSTYGHPRWAGRCDRVIEQVHRKQGSSMT